MNIENVLNYIREKRWNILITSNSIKIFDDKNESLVYYGSEKTFEEALNEVIDEMKEKTTYSGKKLILLGFDGKTIMKEFDLSIFWYKEFLKDTSDWHSYFIDEKDARIRFGPVLFKQNDKNIYMIAQEID